jgi:outer membrane protein, adhesin transport system
MIIKPSKLFLFAITGISLFVVVPAYPSLFVSLPITLDSIKPMYLAMNTEQAVEPSKIGTSLKVESNISDKANESNTSEINSTKPEMKEVIVATPTPKDINQTANDSNTTSKNLSDTLRKMDTKPKDTKESKETLLEHNITLKEAIRYAIKSNYRIKQAKEKWFQAGFSADEALGSILPQVSFTSTATRYVSDQNSTGPFDKSTYKLIDNSLTATMNLFDFGAQRLTYQKAKQTKFEFQKRFQGTIEEEGGKVIKAYFDVVFNRRMMEINQRNFDQLLKILDIVKIKKDLGAASTGDESAIQASVSNAKTALINTDSTLNNANDYYRFLMDDTPANEVNPFEVSFDTSVGESFEPFAIDIQASNTDLEILKAQIRSKQKEFASQKAMTLPKVDFSLTLDSKKRVNYDEPAPQGTYFGRSTKADITLSYNFYTGGRDESKKSRLYSEISALLFDLEYTSKDAKWNSQKLFNSVQTNSRTVETLSSEIDASRRMVNAYWEKFRLSSQDLAVLLQAQRQLNTAELEKLRSEKQRLLDFFELMTKRGKLLEYFGLLE